MQHLETREPDAPDQRRAAQHSPPAEPAERSLALVCRNLFEENNALLSLGRFELVRTLGRGGMGAVYEALDPQRGERVALKMLLGRSPSHLYQLKREFRSLLGLDHPNLVSLHELFIAEGDAYFTMELVEGTDFVSFVRQGAPPGVRVSDERRLCSALLQLSEGVHALHGMGKLHRDLKPSNIRVREDGRVVLLDFGLVRDARDSRGRAEGTAAYMAPEQSRGETCPGSDWYGVGLVLQEALYGARLSPRVAAVAHGQGSGELDALARALAHADPSKRPGFAEIRAVVCGASRPLRAGPLSARRAPFVGRVRELRLLAEAFERSRREAVLALVRGESGIGKSALLAEFLRGPERAGALVLHGRCYEREWLPYKALDGVIDELSLHLLSLPEPRGEQLIVSDAGALLHVFPVLARVPWLRRAAEEPRVLQPSQLRQRGYVALKELLAQLAAERPLVICIDDLQWSDGDSGRLLGALLCAEDPPSILVIASEHDDANQPSAALEELAYASQFAPVPCHMLEIEVGVLAQEDGQQLIESLLPVRSSVFRAEQVSAEARGNPLFLIELARWLSEYDEHVPVPQSLDALLEGRLRALPVHSLELLELMAVAGIPLTARVVEHALGAAIGVPAAADALRAERLARVVRGRGGDAYELAHSQIGRAVLRRLGAEQRVALHRRLARAFEREPGEHCSVLVDQYVGAELPREAAQCALRGARAALASLSFSRAARLFERAIRLGEFSQQESAELHRDHALALEQSGRGLAAAEAYAKAARLSADPLVSVQFGQRAALHLMHNGRHTQGEALVEAGYRTLGIAWPRGRIALTLSIMGRLLVSPLPRWSVRSGSRPAPLRRARAEFCAFVGRGIEYYDPSRAIHNALVCFAEAERLRDPIWDARVLGARGLMRCLSLAPGGSKRGFAELLDACRTASELGDLGAQVDLYRQLSAAYFFEGSPRPALVAGQRCVALLRQLPRTPLDICPVMGLCGASLADLGELHEARRHWSTFAHEARIHGDLMVSTWVHANPARVFVLLADDDRAGVHGLITLLDRMRGLHPRCRIVAWEYAASKLESALYYGSGLEGVQLAEQDKGLLFGTGYRALTRKVRTMRARARLARAAELPRGRERNALVRAALADAPLRSSAGPHDQGVAQLVAAGAHALQDQPESALASLDRAIGAFDLAGAKLKSACARYCKGALLGGDAGRTLQDAARAALTAEAVVDHVRSIAWTASGFRAALGALP